MLGVLKRRLKPKRPSEKETGRKNGKSEAIVPVDMARITSSQRQIHPLFEEKAQLLAYDDVNTCKRQTPTPSLKRSPDDPLPNPHVHPHLQKRGGCAELLPSPTPGSPPGVYHPAPNICVEGGRIEFIKTPTEGNAVRVPESKRGTSPTASSQSPGFPHRKSFGLGTTTSTTAATTTRAQQTQADIGDLGDAEEKCDIAKEFLEARIKELERLLEAEQKSGQRERLAVARLQRQLSRREVTHRDVDRERRLRADTESRLRDTVVESERYRATLAGLQREFSRMEDTVRTMLQYKSRCEVLNQEKVTLAAAYETHVHQYQTTISKLNQENESLRHQLRLLEASGAPAEIQSTLLDRLRTLETENAHIIREADFQRKQYEKCLDDIANQVVRALLSQKGLREEIGNLQRRIKELENQNHALSNILVRKLEGCEPRGGHALVGLDRRSWFPGSYGPTPAVMSSSVPDDGGRQALLLPMQRPRSLNLYLHASRVPIGNVFNGQHRSKLNIVHLAKDEGNESPESGNKDEGYSTMSSDVQGPSDSNELSKRELEDLKEASDETEVVKLDTAGTAYASVVLVEDVTDPDIFFIPLNFTFAINPRHSYPPTKDFLPFQHVMRSFSDSHLCLKLTPNSPLLTAPISPSVLLVEKASLRRTKAAASLTSKEDEVLQEMDETQSSPGSWCSGAAEGCWWDTEYIQHCVKFDDVHVRLGEYDNTELEDWSFSLSCEDIAKGETPCTNGGTAGKELWSVESPAGSWSSVTSNNSDYSCRDCSKRSSVASDDAESSLVGTDFTRDFYRLVKFESTKSLASNSSRSIGERETNSDSALKNVLTFIAEQQLYCNTREEEGKEDDCGHGAEEVEKCQTVVEEVAPAAEEDRTDVCDKEVLTTIREEESPTEKSPRRMESLIPVPKPSAVTSKPSQQQQQQKPRRPRGTKIPVRSPPKTEPVRPRGTSIPVPTGRKTTVIGGDKTDKSMKKAVVADDGSFHEKATSKDVIDELNRMIRKGEEVTPGSTDGDMKPLDIACCCPTGWVHVERDIDFTDPKARANLLDVMLASSGSSGASGSSSDSGGDDPVDYSHLHRIHRFRRQRKACATRKEELGALRFALSSVRPSIIGRENFFVRFGEKEREAIASFDFLEDFSTGYSSSCDTIGSSVNVNTQKGGGDGLGDEEDGTTAPFPETDMRTPTTPTTPATPSDDSDDRTGGPVESLSDSCANSYTTESTASLEYQC